MAFTVQAYDKTNNKKIYELEFVSLKWAREYSSVAEKASKSYYFKIEEKDVQLSTREGS
jgi:hypothetical protein